MDYATFCSIRYSWIRAAKQSSMVEQNHEDEDKPYYCLLSRKARDKVDQRGLMLLYKQLQCKSKEQWTGVISTFGPRRW